MFLIVLPLSNIETNHQFKMVMEIKLLQRKPIIILVSHNFYLVIHMQMKLEGIFFTYPFFITVEFPVFSVFKTSGILIQN